MQILIGCAKTMNGSVPRLIAGCTEPQYQRIADHTAMLMSRYSVDELQAMLHCSAAIARENWFRYRRFIDPSTRRPAVFSYEGMVYRTLAPETMTDSELAYANEHLNIASFLYGLLRPLDLVNPYRLEGNVRLPGNDHKSMFDFWKPILTDRFIDKVKADDGVLVNLASREFRNMFDWGRIESELEVITPEFRVDKEGKPKVIVIYAKMCRGAMAGWLLRNRIVSTAVIKEFEYEGFHHDQGREFLLKA